LLLADDYLVHGREDRSEMTGRLRYVKKP